MNYIGKKALGIGMAAMLALGSGTSALAAAQAAPVTGTPPYIMNFDASELLARLMDENGVIAYELPVEADAKTAEVVCIPSDIPEGLTTLSLSAFGTVLHVPAAILTGLPANAGMRFAIAADSFSFMLINGDGDDFVWRDHGNAIIAEVPFRAPVDISTHQLVLESNGVPAARSRYADGKIIAAINQSGVYAPSIQGLGEFDDLQGHWSGTAVGYLHARGVLASDTYARYAPDKAVTRDVFNDMLIRALGAIPELEEGQSLNDELTRGEMFRLVYGAMEHNNLLPPVFTMQWILFPDWPADLDGESSAAFQNLAKMKLIQGNSQGFLNLSNTASRAEAAQLLYNALVFSTK